MKSKIKMFVNDSFINILATGIFILTQQFIIFPIISSNTTVEFFGTILTIIAIKNMLMQIFGGSLNNLNLINYDYNRRRSLGGFNILLLTSMFLAMIITFVLLWIYGENINKVDYFLMVITVGISIINLYGIVYFRINLEYRKILLVNIILSIGNFIGLFLYFILNNWSLIFFLSELFGLIFLLLTTPLFKELIKIRFFYSEYKNLKILKKDYLNLLFSSCISNVVIYFDRLLINPLLGGKAVSQYYVASLTGKTFSMVITPINGVLLSYTSRYKNKLSVKTLKLVGIFTLLFIMIGIPILNTVSPLVINLLYPKIYNEAQQYINLVNIVVLTGIASSILNPFILSKCDLKWQPRINILYGMIYIGLGFLFTNQYGLYGFGISSIISNVTRLIYIYLVGIMTAKKIKFTNG